MLNDQDILIWRIFLQPPNSPDADYGYRVDIDALSGKVVNVVHQKAGLDNVWASYYE